MAIELQTCKDNLRNIEDFINIQKANGSLSIRQLTFNFPGESSLRSTAGLVRSLESGLTRPTRVRKRGQRRGRRAGRPATAAPVRQSDSDVTVVRMKACGCGVGVVGDGSERADRDGCSLVNLATLVPPGASKRPAHELLLPLSSWQNPFTLGPVSPPHLTAKSRLARFLRLYFCPCSTCLYRMENDRKDASEYFTTPRRSVSSVRC